MKTDFPWNEYKRLRNKARKKRNRLKMQRQFKKEKEIGIDPLFSNGPRKEREERSKEWKKEREEMGGK